MLAHLCNNISPTRLGVRRDATWVPIRKFSRGQSRRDPISANDDGLRAIQTCEIRIVDSEGAVVIEPVIPPAGIARRGLPEVICRGGESRLREQGDIDIERTRLCNRGHHIRPEHILARQR